MHALIIEDEAIVALSVQDALRDCGCTSFDVACTVESAIAAAKLRCPDIITSDVQLKPGCGIDAVQAICAGRHIPVIYITGSPAEVEKRVASHVIVSKPFSSAQVARAVARVL